MTDIIERLRREGTDAFHKRYSLGMWKLCMEAANEIERLQAEFEIQRAALHNARKLVEALTPHA